MLKDLQELVKAEVISQNTADKISDFYHKKGEDSTEATEKVIFKTKILIKRSRNTSLSTLFFVSCNSLKA
ncbi:MAG: hypothetical protein APF83_04050 [Lutibacter sp. BRH_c52]|nr:MAG: hypothetical protein APF83_04050 [Lutibacter sp. BRH_c52]